MDCFGIESNWITAQIYSEYSVIKPISIQKRYNKNKDGEKIPYTQGVIALPEDYIDRYTISLLLEKTETNNLEVARVTKNNGDRVPVFGISLNTVRLHNIGRGYSAGRLLYSGEWLDKQVLIICLPNMN